MKKFFINCDFLGPTANIYIKGKHRFRTKTGSLLSILCVFCILFLNITYFYFFIKNKTPNIYEYLDNTGNYSFYLKNSSIKIKVVDNNNKDISSNFIEIIPFFWNISKDNKEIIQLNTTYCNVNDKNLENFICLNIKSFDYSIRNFKNDNSSFLKFHISKCTNNTENNNCHTIEDINAFLIKNDLKILIYLEDNYISHNKNIPFSLNNYYTEIDFVQGFFYEYNFNYEKILYKTDNGYFFPNKNKKDFYTLIKNPNDLKIYPSNYQSYYPNSIMEINLKINGESIRNINRNYFKLSSLLSDLICLSWFIYKIFHVICRIINKGRMFTEMMNTDEIVETEKLFDEEMKNNICQKIPSQNITYSFTNQNMNNSSCLLNLSVNNNQMINNPNNNIKGNSNKNLINIFSSKFKNEKLKIKKKRKIDFCSSFLYNINCINTTLNKKLQFILICELIVKQIINSEELIRKFYQIELMLINKNSINNNLINHSENSDRKDLINTNSIKVKTPQPFRKNNIDMSGNNTKNETNIITIIREEDEN